MTWRCGEGGGTSHSTDGSGKCYNSLPPQPPPHADTTLCEWVDSYGWVYVWPAAHNVWGGASGDRSTAKAVPPPIDTPEVQVILTSSSPHPHIVPILTQPSPNPHLPCHSPRHRMSMRTSSVLKVPPARPPAQSRSYTAAGMW